MAAKKTVHECLFCPHTFESAAAKDDHVLEHFAQETCLECNRNLIRIGDSLYVKHDASVCSIKAPKSEKSVTSTSTEALAPAQDNDSQCVPNIAYESIKTEQQNMADDSNEPMDFGVLVKLDDFSTPSTAFEDDNQSMASDIECKLQELFRSERTNIDSEQVQQNGKESTDAFDKNSYDSINRQDDSSDFETNDLDVELPGHRNIISDRHCDLCSISYKHSKSYRKHMAQVHAQNVVKFRCKPCQRVFNKEICFREHTCKPPCNSFVDSQEPPTPVKTDKVKNRALHRTECTEKQKSRMNTNSDRHCDLCRISYKHSKSYRKHMAQVHAQNVVKFRCKPCQRVFNKEICFREHTCKPPCKSDGMHLVKAVVCTFCGLQFVRKPNLEKHIVRMHTNVYCEICKNTFDKQELYDSHKAACSIGVPNMNRISFECDICNQKMKNINTFKQHMVLFHSPASVSGGNFVQKASLENHTDGMYKNVFCKICLNTFNQQEQYDSHKAACSKSFSSTSEIPLECYICHRKMKNIYKLKRHMALRHSLIGTVFCAECGKTFLVVDERDQHQVQCKMRKRLSDLKPAGHFECDICHSTYNTKMELWRDMVVKHIPDGDRFKCKRCGHIFFQEAYSQIHKCKGRGRESERRRIQCETCGKIVVKGALKTHRIAFHSAPGTIFCRTCFKIFSNDEGLLAHRPKCKKNKFNTPRECKICNKMMSNYGTFSRHNITHHSTGIIFCRRCARKFKTTEELNAHEPACSLKRKLQKQRQKLKKQNPLPNDKNE